MKKISIIIFILMVLLANQVKAQSPVVIYDLPKKVIAKTKKYIALMQKENASAEFVAKLYKIGDSNHRLLITTRSSDTSEVNKLLEEGIIKKTHRMLKLDDDFLIPIVFNEDLAFAELDRMKLPDGKIRTKKIFWVIDLYAIDFDANGKLIN